MTDAISVVAFRDHTGEILDRVQGGQRYIIQRFSRPVAGLVPIADLKRLEEPMSEDQAAYHLDDQGHIQPSAQALVQVLLKVHHEDRAAAARALLAHIQAEQAALALLLATNADAE